MATDVITRIGVALHVLLSGSALPDAERAKIQELATELMEFEARDAQDDLLTGKRIADLESEVVALRATIEAVAAAAASNEGVNAHITQVEGVLGAVNDRVSTLENGLAGLADLLEALGLVTPASTVVSGEGSDTVDAPVGDDTILGGAGNDVISVDGTAAPVEETPASPAETVAAGLGDDSVAAPEAAETVAGGASDDIVDPLPGEPVAEEPAPAPVAEEAPAAETVAAPEATDTVDGGAAADVVEAPVAEEPVADADEAAPVADAPAADAAE